MATTTYWNPNGQTIAQVATLTITAVANGGTLTATINGKSITYTCVVSDTTATATAAWLLLLQASTVPLEFSEITWASPTTTTITATASSPGTPFTLTKSQAGGSTCTLTATTANSSPSDVFNANNWLRVVAGVGSASLPVAGDDVVVANSSVPLLWNLDQLATYQFNSYTRFQSFTGSVGLPEYNPNGYVEYRPTYFQFSNYVALTGALPVILGVGPGAGPTRERYNVGGARTALNVLAAGSPLDAYAVRFLGSHGLNSLTILGTSVGVAMLPGETATINTATIDGGGTLDCGAGCAFSGTGGGGTVTYTGGSGTLFCVPTVVARNNATITLAAQGGTYASITANNGVQLTVACAMTISVLTLQKSSNMDLSANLGAVTITTSTLDGDTCQVIDPNNCVTWSNATTINGQVTTGCITFTGSRTMKIT